MYQYIDNHIDRSLLKEHVGYIVDRTGYPVFRQEVLSGVDLGQLGRVAESINFAGYFYERTNIFR